MTGTVISSGLVIDSSAIDDLNTDSPLIGYRTLVTTSNIAATTQASDFPATNLANAITHELWKSAAVATFAEYITVTFSPFEPVDYLAIAAHNFGSNLMAVSVEGQTQAVDSFTKLLLHFDGADASTTFTDSSPSARTMTAVGNAQIDTADRKFGTASGLFDGSGDYLTTPDSVDFTFGTGDFTVDGWFKVNTALPALTLAMVGKTDSLLTNAGSSFVLRRTTSNVWEFRVSDGSTTTVITGTTPFTSILNPGWHHVAGVRSGNTLMLFVDGVLEASAAFTGTVNDTATVLYVGARDSVNQDAFFGWLDEVRVSKGIARWTANFTPPVDAPWTRLTTPRVLTTDGPIVFRFTKQNLLAIRLKIEPSAAAIPVAAQAGVMYTGELLYMQRRIYVGHTPDPMARRLQVANNVSVSGAFMGRIVLGQTRQNSAAFQNLTPAWYRENFDPFLIAAQEIPFFFAWRPGTYPDEAGFAWLTGDPIPDNQRANGMMQITFDYEGVA